MMIHAPMHDPALTDTELVASSLNGSRAAFGEIVKRYQTLVCSLAYSSLGSISRSEDVAQEVFVAAWKELRQLREPAKLRPWLCAITRRLTNSTALHERREPAAGAVELDPAHTIDAPDPAQRIMAKEEEAIVWRSLAQMPPSYREPLVLYYRQDKSVETVAAELGLSTDTVKQRLSRGRRLLRGRVAGLVEDALRQTVPGGAFAFGVLASLPLMSSTAAAATLGSAAVKTSATATGASVLGWIGAFIGPAIGCVGGWLGMKASLENARSAAERRLLRRQIRIILAVMGVFLAVTFGALALRPLHPVLLFSVQAAAVISYVAIILTLVLRFNRQHRQLQAQEAARPDPAVDVVGVVAVPAVSAVPTSTLFEFKSRAMLLGLPLIHIRAGRRRGDRLTPALGWIAVGDVAVGALLSIGGIAFGGVSIGGLSLGLLAIGGAALGVASGGGLAIGAVAALGGVSIAWMAHGGFALAWHAAEGGVAIAHHFAQGGTAFAAHANDAAAREVIGHSAFFRAAEAAKRNPVWYSIVWLPMLLVIWQSVASRFKSPRHSLRSPTAIR